MAGGGGGTEELNLVPYLDVMVNLIVFMIVITAYIVQLKESPVLPPNYGDNKGQDEQEQKAFLTVAITTEGYSLIGGGRAEGQGAPIPKRNGQYDPRALTVGVKAIKAAIPDLSDNVVIMADGNARYADVILAMDAVRFDGRGDKILFNGVTFAKQVQ